MLATIGAPTAEDMVTLDHRLRGALQAHSHHGVALAERLAVHLLARDVSRTNGAKGAARSDDGDGLRSAGLWLAHAASLATAYPLVMITSPTFPRLSPFELMARPTCTASIWKSE